MSIKNSATRLAAYAAGAAVTLALAGAVVALPAQAAGLSSSQVQTILGMLQAFGVDQATINNVQAALTGQATTGTTVTTTTSGASCTAWTRNLTVGATGADVMALQKFLNSNAATQVAASGAGSMGMETSTFGPATKAALAKYQTLNGISPAAGYFGPATRAKVNASCTSTTTTGGTTTGGTTTTTTGTGLTVSAGAQPVNAVIPYGVARAPFTTFTVTASNDGDVTLNSVTVQRQGISKDTDVSNVELLDHNGNIVGLTKTLNSNHQAVIGSAIVIARGTSQTFTVAADTQSDNTLIGSGDIVSFAVVAVNSTATVNGSLPIVGASNTMNSTLTIGKVTVVRGTNDPGAANTENVGTTNYIFSSIRLTAGSAEDVYLKSIRWHQVGSASQSYLQNVVTVVGGTSYPTTVSSDNYYLTTFPGQGILMTKGNSQDVAIQGDIVNGSNTNVEFDVQKRNDISAVGATYGFGILPSFSTDSTICVASTGVNCGAVKASDDPYYVGFLASINAGTVNVSTGSLPASNVATNQSNVVIGSYSVQILGEPVTIGKLIFNVSKSSGSSATYADLTSVSLVDQTGNVLAGPVDAAAGTGGQFKLTFTDTVTFPVGTTQLSLKGKLGSNFATNDTIAASTTPSTMWTTVTGQTTGKSLTASPSSSLTSAVMTVKAQALAVSVASTPIGQTVIAGNNQFTFANINLSANSSGEDVRVTTLPLKYTWTGNANDLTNCYLYNGGTNVTDAHVVNPTSANTTGSDVSFSLNSGGITVPKGSTVTLSVKCDVRSGVSGTYHWGLSASPSIGASGVTSGNTVIPSVTAATGNAMVASASGGALTITADSSSPVYNSVAAGSTGVDLGHLRFTATTENVDLRQVALQLTSGNGYDLVNNTVTLVDHSTQKVIGTAQFATGAYATSSAIVSGDFTIPANDSRVLEIHGDIAGISTNGPIQVSGDNIKVSYDGNNVGLNGNYGVGVSSNQNVTPSTNTDVTPVAHGVNIYKSVPTFTYSTSGGSLSGGLNTLLTLNVAADAKGDVELGSLKFAVSTTTVTLSGLTFNGPNGAVNDTTVSESGATGSQVITVLFDSASNSNDRIVAANSTNTYTLSGVVNGLTTTGGVVSVALMGDSSLPVIQTNGNGLASSTGTFASQSVLWSPLSTSRSAAVPASDTRADWTNAYGLLGCFKTVGLGNNCQANVLSK